VGRSSYIPEHLYLMGEEETPTELSDDLDAEEWEDARESDRREDVAHVYE